MKPIKIVAFDLSLTASGYASVGYRADQFDPKGISIGTLKPPDLDGLPRLQWIRDNVLSLSTSAAVVVVEGYSFGSGHQAHQMGELGGVVRLALHELKRPFVIVPPASRAKYATGKGNAPKDAVLAEAIRRLAYPGHDHNEADALWLLTMAGDHYEQPWRTQVPTGHREALEAITWPKLGKPRQ